MVVSGYSEAESSEESGGTGEGTGRDDGVGSTGSAFVSPGSGLGSEKLSFCRFPGKHIPGKFYKDMTRQCVRIWRADYSRKRRLTSVYQAWDGVGCHGLRMMLSTT